MKAKGKIFERVYLVVRRIPAGKVATYGEIARTVGTTARVVGFALHVNPYSDDKKADFVPCHRVVDRNGRLAPSFAFGGAREQYLRLKAEKVIFLDETHVNLEKHCLTL